MTHLETEISTIAVITIVIIISVAAAIAVIIVLALRKKSRFVREDSRTNQGLNDLYGTFYKGVEYNIARTATQDTTKMEATMMLLSKMKMSIIRLIISFECSQLPNKEQCACSS